MQASHPRRFQSGIAAFAIAALLFALFPIVRPVEDFPLPEKATEVARVLSSTAWVVSHAMIIVALVALIFGLLTLYGYLASSRVERRAYLALIFSLVGIGFLLPITGTEAFGLRAAGQMYLQGKADLDALLKSIRYGASSLFFFPALLLLAVGAILFGVAIWQSGLLPKWAGVCLAVGLALFLPLLPRGLRIADGLLTGIGGVGLAWGMWRPAARTTAEELRIAPG